MRSGSKCANALIRGFNDSICWMNSSANSIGEIVEFRNIASSSTAGSSVMFFNARPLFLHTRRLFSSAQRSGQYRWLGRSGYIAELETIRRLAGFEALVPIQAVLYRVCIIGEMLTIAV